MARIINKLQQKGRQKSIIIQEELPGHPTNPNALLEKKLRKTFLSASSDIASLITPHLTLPFCNRYENPFSNAIIRNF